MNLFRPTIFLGPTNIPKVAVIKTESATIAFSFFHLFYPSLLWFWSLSGPKTLPFDTFYSNHCKVRFKKSARYKIKHQRKAAFHRDKYRALECLYEYMNELLSTRLYGLYKAVSPGNRRYAVSQIVQVWGQSIQRAIINGKVVCFPIKGAEKNHQHEVPLALSYMFLL